MNIENSPFHISNKKNSNVKEIVQSNSNLKNPNNKEIENKENFSFWDWFRGLVNPFQNLPIVSGIYSSMNSEDSKSDRDLVQNSLGGFMYGGPIGAIAGFGNWVFNKIFNKTPTELALDVTGISNLWKDDDRSTEEKIVTNLDIKNNEMHSSFLKKNNHGEWWMSNQMTNLESQKPSNKEIKKNLQLVAKDLSIIENKQNATDISLKYDLANTKIVKNKETFEKKSNPLEQIVSIKKKQEPVQVNHDTSLETNEGEINKRKFREINFDYPVWKPESLEISKNQIDQKSKDFMNQKYMELKKESIGLNLNLKL